MVCIWGIGGSCVDRIVILSLDVGDMLRGTLQSLGFPSVRCAQLAYFSDGWNVHGKNAALQDRCWDWMGNSASPTVEYETWFFLCAVLRYGVPCCILLCRAVFVCRAVFLCAAMCFGVPRCVLVCRAVFWSAVLCFGVPCYVLLCRAVFLCAVLCFVPCCFLVCLAVFLCAVLCFVVLLCFVVPCCVLVCRVVFFCAVLCFVVPCCVLVCRTVFWWIKYKLNKLQYVTWSFQ
jgi:hypothetical protein